MSRPRAMREFAAGHAIATHIQAERAVFFSCGLGFGTEASRKGSKFASDGEGKGLTQTPFDAPD